MSSCLALSLVLWIPMQSLAAEPAERVVAVIDFRSDEYAPEFRSRFGDAMRRAMKRAGGPGVRILYVQTTRPGFEAAARKLSSDRPDVFYATTIDVARAVRGVDPKVPVVFSGLVDPVKAGLLRSIERPDNNMTGFVSHGDVDDKRVELLAELSPRIRRVGVLFTRGFFSDEDLRMRLEVGRKRGVAVVPLIIDRDAAEGAVLRVVGHARLDALDAPASPIVSARAEALIALAKRDRIPISFRPAAFVKKGALLSYEPSEFDYPEKAAEIITRILMGTSPADIPVEFPSEFVLSLNARAVRNLPYPVSKDLLKRANHVYP